MDSDDIYTLFRFLFGRDCVEGKRKRAFYTSAKIGGGGTS